MFDWIVSLVEHTGYVGIALLLFMEDIFPPLPSEVVLPLAGFLAAQGRLNPVGVVAAGSLGSLAGATFWYFVAMHLGTGQLKSYARRYGRWLTLHPRDIDHVKTWFDRHGKKAVFYGRLLPGVHSLVSVPAGVSRMKPLPFLIFTLGGTLCWIIPYVLSGYLLQGNYMKVSQWMSPISSVMLIGFASFYAWRVMHFHSDQTDKKEAA